MFSSFFRKLLHCMVTLTLGNLRGRNKWQSAIVRRGCHIHEEWWWPLAPLSLRASVYIMELFINLKLHTSTCISNQRVIPYYYPVPRHRNMQNEKTNWVTQEPPKQAEIGHTTKSCLWWCRGRPSRAKCLMKLGKTANWSASLRILHFISNLLGCFEHGNMATLYWAWLIWSAVVCTKETVSCWVSEPLFSGFIMTFDEALLGMFHNSPANTSYVGISRRAKVIIMLPKSTKTECCQIGFVWRTLLVFIKEA